MTPLAEAKRCVTFILRVTALYISLLYKLLIYSLQTQHIDCILSLDLVDWVGVMHMHSVAVVIDQHEYRSDSGETKYMLFLSVINTQGPIIQKLSISVIVTGKHYLLSKPLIILVFIKREIFLNIRKVVVWINLPLTIYYHKNDVVNNVFVCLNVVVIVLCIPGSELLIRQVKCGEADLLTSLWIVTKTSSGIQSLSIHIHSTLSWSSICVSSGLVFLRLLNRSLSI